MKLLKGQKTKARIIRKAIRLIAKKGFHEASFQMIADACGLTQSAVMNHMRNRKILIKEVLQYIIRHNHQNALPLWLLLKTDNVGVQRFGN